MRVNSFRRAPFKNLSMFIRFILEIIEESYFHNEHRLSLTNRSSARYDNQRDKSSRTSWLLIKHVGRCVSILLLSQNGVNVPCQRVNNPIHQHHTTRQPNILSSKDTSKDVSNNENGDGTRVYLEINILKRIRLMWPKFCKMKFSRPRFTHSSDGLRRTNLYSFKITMKWLSSC